MNLRALPHCLPVCTGILKLASLLVPGKMRAEWLEEWSSELWHVWRVCNQNEYPASFHGKEEATAFSLGAFKDAYWLRRSDASLAPRRILRTGTPSRCILTLAVIALASFLLAYCRPAVWSVARPVTYRDSVNLVMITRKDFGMAARPSVQFSEYQAWSNNSGHLFTGLAFYQLTTVHLATGSVSSTAVPMARASSNLFELLGIAISFEFPVIDSRSDVRLLLSRSAWHKYFQSDPHIFGQRVRVDGQAAMVAGIVPDEAWRLPGQADVWLLEGSQRLAGLRADSEGYVLAHAAPSVFHVDSDGRHPMYVAHKNEGYDWFVCDSVDQRLRQPLSTFCLALLLACLALPATTSLPLGEYPASGNQVPWSTRIRRWAFLSIKFLLIVPIAYFGALDLAYSSRSTPVGTAEMLEMFASFWGLLFAFRWALRDQRQRCPVCLRTLTNPARVGQFSRNFLAWNGTELVCLSGHGLLHVPDIPTSWFGSQRWLYLDPSWRTLFPVST